MTRSNLLLTSSLVALTTLVGCSKETSDWHRDCQRHYSTTSRELSQCKQKVEDNASATITQGKVSLDPANTARKDFDDLGKGGASDK